MDYPWYFFLKLASTGSPTKLRMTSFFYRDYVFQRFYYLCVVIKTAWLLEWEGMLVAYSLYSCCAYFSNSNNSAVRSVMLLVFFEHLSAISWCTNKIIPVWIAFQRQAFFFNRRYWVFRLPQRILIHINSEALPITYSVCCVFVELADKLYNP